MGSVEEGRTLVNDPGLKIIVGSSPSPRLGDLLGKTEVLLSSKPHHFWDADYAPQTMDPYFTFSTEEYGKSAGRKKVHNFQLEKVQSTRPPKHLNPVEVKEMLSKSLNSSGLNPNFVDVINFPRNSGGYQNGKKTNGGTKAKLCVMCGLLNIGEGGCFIRRQNKGVCTICDSDFWIQSSTGCLIKWCKGCKNFLSGTKFGKKVGASKCESCRNRVKTAYTKKKGAPIQPIASQCPDGFSVDDKLCRPKTLVLGSNREGRAKLLLSTVKNYAGYNFTSPRAGTSPRMIYRPLTTTIREAIAAMTVQQGTATSDSLRKKPMIKINSEEDQSRKGDTALHPSTSQQLPIQLKRTGTCSQPSPNGGQSYRPSSSNNEVYGKAAPLLGKDIVHDSMYPNSHVMQRPSPKLMAAPAANALMSIIEDREGKSSSLKKSFDRLGFLVSLLGEEGSSELQNNKANGGAPSLAVTRQSPPIFFDPGVDEWAKKRKISPSHFIERNVQIDMANNNMNTGECPSPLSDIPRHIPVHSV